MEANDLTVGEIRAKSLVIVDDDDHPRAVIGTAEDGVVAFSLLDETGKHRASLLHTTGQESALQFKAADGTLRISLIASDNGNCMIMLHGEDGALRVSLNCDR